jgi:hypothetical protein
VRCYQVANLWLARGSKRDTSIFTHNLLSIRFEALVGGPAFANNYPLRGSKGDDFEVGLPTMLRTLLPVASLFPKPHLY